MAEGGPNEVFMFVKPNYYCCFAIIHFKRENIRSVGYINMYAFLYLNSNSNSFFCEIAKLHTKNQAREYKFTSGLVIFLFSML